MKDVLIFGGFLMFWIVLNVWVLPYFGIQTCMCGACRVPRVEHEEPSRTMHDGVSDGESLRKER